MFSCISCVLACECALFAIFLDFMTCILVDNVLSAYNDFQNEFSRRVCTLSHSTSINVKFSIEMLLAHECKPFGLNWPLPLVTGRLEPEADSVRRLGTWVNVWYTRVLPM